jgi:hypothetical protein
MNTNDIKCLLPFYLAKKLSDEEASLVESELKESKELQDALRILKNIQHVANTHGSFQRQGHLTPQEILDYVEKRMTKSDIGLADQHLQQCEYCAEVCHVMRETYIQVSPPIGKTTNQSQAFAGKIAHQQFQYFKSHYVAFAGTILSIVLIVSFLIWRSTPLVESSVSLTMRYHEITRGIDTSNYPSLIVPANLSSIQLHLSFPTSGIDSTRYSVTVIDPSRLTTKFPGLVFPIHENSGMDSLDIIIEGKYLNREGGYDLNIAEEFQKPLIDIEPKVYDFHFNVLFKK